MPQQPTMTVAATRRRMAWVLLGLTVRFRRARHDERLQLKWFMYASIFAAVVFFAVGEVIGNPLPVFEIVLLLIPAAVGIAVLKYRARYDADQMVTAFAGGLWDAVDLEAVRSDLLAVVNNAVEPVHISVWVAEGGDQDLALVAPQPSWRS